MTSDLPLQSNPFGAAKPINAEARLKELEEKIAKEKVCKGLPSRCLHTLKLIRLLLSLRTDEAHPPFMRWGHQSACTICTLFGQAERAAAAREAEQKAREQAGEASPGLDQQEGSGRPSEASPSLEDNRATGSGRFQGPPPGTTRTPGAPPSGSGRGQGRGASLDAANGRLAVPPGMEASREELGGRGGRGRRGRVRSK